MSLKKTIEEIESILGYTFKVKKNLINSLIHPSFNKNIQRLCSNESICYRYHLCQKIKNIEWNLTL